jgi:hypothetical protein
VEAEVAARQRAPEQQQKMDRDITAAEVVAVINKMAVAKAGGCDGVLPFMLKRGGEGMVAGLRRLLQTVWEQEAVPVEWKRGQVVPIFKGGTESALGDYRGITLLSVVGKVLEGVVLARVEKWLAKTGGLSDEQGGFRAGRGTADLIWLVSEVVQRRREQKQRSFVCFVDVQKAYDTVWQAGLWKRLWDVGVRGKAWRLLQEWYRGCTSSVLVDGEETRAFDLQQGVKQGAVLSPVLYAVFIDGVVEELRRRRLGVEEAGVWVGIVLYADDMALLARSREELEAMMAVVVEYSRRWRFGLNAGKTKVLVVGEKKKERQARAGKDWMLGSAKVEEVEVFKYLGVELRRDGKWTDVAKRLGEKAGAVASILLGMGGVCEKMGMGLRRRLWLALGAAVMRYGTEVWYPSKGELARLELVQRQAGRRVLGCGIRLSDEVVRGELGWWTVRGQQAEAKLRFLGRLLAMPKSRVVRRLLMVRAADLESGLGCGKGWCARTAKLVAYYGLTEACGTVELAVWNKLVRTAVWDKEEEEWRAAMATKPSLEQYQRLKTVLELEPLVDGGVEHWRSAGLLVKLRGAGSDLEVETGKRLQQERHDRLCTACNSGAVGDVAHFLLECVAVTAARSRLWHSLELQLANLADGPAVWRVVAALLPADRVDVMLGKRDPAWSSGVVGALDCVFRRGIWDMWRSRKNHIGVILP